MCVECIQQGTSPHPVDTKVKFRVGILYTPQFYFYYY